MPLVLDLLEVVTTGMDDGSSESSFPDDFRLLLKPRQLFNDHFEKIEWTSSAGSSMGYVPLTDHGNPDFYCVPEPTKTGQYTLFEAGGPLRDSLYRGSSITFFQPLKNGDQLFAEFYNRRFQYPYRESVESPPREVRVRGVNLGIKF